MPPKKSSRKKNKKPVKNPVKKIVKPKVKKEVGCELQEIFGQALKVGIPHEKIRKDIIKYGLEELEKIEKDPKKAFKIRNKWTSTLDKTFRKGGKRIMWFIKPGFWEPIQEELPFLNEKSWIKKSQEKLDKAVKNFKVTKIKTRSGKTIILPPLDRFDTKADLLLEIVKMTKKISVKELSKILKADYEIVEEWANELSENNLVKMKYPLIGHPYLKIK
ncbi:MAG: hypothetical protein GOU97_04405 [Nanoarchaeota archaeon]|nr:hypothetical protein [Nanoarchaeota archaeon]